MRVAEDSAFPFLGVWDLGPLPSEDSPCWLWVGDCFLDQGQILPALGLRQTVLDEVYCVGWGVLATCVQSASPAFLQCPLEGLPLPTRRPRAFGRTACLHLETSCGRGSFLGCSVPPCSFGRELRRMGGERPPRTKPWSFGNQHPSGHEPGHEPCPLARGWGPLWCWISRFALSPS